MEEEKTGKGFIVFIIVFVVCLVAFLYVRKIFLTYIHSDSDYADVVSKYIVFDSDYSDLDNVVSDSGYADVDYDYVDVDWNEFKWEDITICNVGSTICITLMDRNLWAATNDISKTWSYWYYFQWWNNYWFNARFLNGKVWQVDASGYWPNNPYNSDVFLYWYTNRSSVWNDDLWWWSWDSEKNHWWWHNIYATAEGRQWPCPEWYHVPSIWERNELLYFWYNSLNTKYWVLSKNYPLFQLTDEEWKIWNIITEYFYLPTAGNIITNRWQLNGTGDLIPRLVWLTSEWTIAKFWSSTPFWQYDKWWSHDFFRTFSVSLFENMNTVSAGVSGIGGSEWLPIRCFKNPDNIN